MELRKTVLLIVIILALTLYAAASVEGEDEDEDEEEEEEEEREIEDENLFMIIGHQHGVRLASWRWDQYSNTITFTGMLILAAILKILFHRTPGLRHIFPESCVLIVIGIFAGVIVFYGLEDKHHHFPKFTAEIFFNVLLPPIILDAAYSLYDRDFLGNLGSVLLFAVVGTLFNVFLIGFAIFFLGRVGLMDPGINLPILQCLIFSALISAVDPVAVLAIFEEIGVNKGLYFLVFGESLLNDGVTVVIYNTVVALAAQNAIDSLQYLWAFLSFFTVVFGGLFIGIFFGVLSAVVCKYTGRTRVMEPLLMLSMGYMAFIVAETIHWSGIISIIGCGICQKRYAFPNVSKKTYTTIKYGVKTLSSISDCIIFLFLGTVTISQTYDFEPQFIGWTIALCLIIRFIGVFFLSWILNFRRIKPITLQEQFIMAYGGLRGAVGFSLAHIIPDTNPLKNMFMTTTLIVIFFTVFIQGGTIKLLVAKLKIKRKSEKDNSVGGMVNTKTMDYIMTGIESIAGRFSRYTIMEMIRNFDENYIKIWVIKKGTVHKIERKLQEVTLDEHYARLYGPTVLVTDSKVDKIIEVENEAEKEDSVFVREDDNRKTLKKAFNSSHYDRFVNRYRRNTISADDDDDDLVSQLERMHKRATIIGRQLLDEQRLNATPQSERTRLLWQGAASAALIKKQYEEAKDKFKGRDHV